MTSNKPPDEPQNKSPEELLAGQPLEIVVRPRDVAVGARRDVNDDLPLPLWAADLL